MIIDAQGTTFVFNGETVGKVTQYTIADGDVPDVLFQGLDQSATRAYPGKPDFGNITVTLYRDSTDAGQEKIQASINNSAIVPASITLTDGRVLSFQAYGKTLPITGLIDSVNTSNAVIRIHEGVTVS